MDLENEQKALLSSVSEILTVKQVAELVGMSVSYLDKCRMATKATGKLVGPRFVRIGNKTIRYLRTDVENWVREQASATGIGA